MPDREKVIKETEDGITFAESRGFGGLANTMRDALVLLKEQDTCENCAIAIEDRQPVVRCKNCKHRPKEPDWKIYESGFDLEFPEGSKCPCRCSGDKWYSWYPEDDWFCADGERKEGR